MTDKYEKEYKRLLKKYGLIIAKLNVIDADIVIQRDLEKLNDIPFLIRQSVEMERQREKWQIELRKVKVNLLDMIKLMGKNDSKSEK